MTNVSSSNIHLPLASVLIFTYLSTNVPRNYFPSFFCLTNVTNLFPMEGAGVNLILDCIGGSYWEKNVNCLALDGRWILYGLMGGADVSGPLFSKLLSKRGSLITSLLKNRDKKVSDE